MAISKITSSVAAVLILIVALVGNYYLNVYEATIHSFFVGNTDDGNGNVDSETQENVLGLADDVVREIAADSMVLLKNDNDCLPLDKTRNAKINLFGYNATEKGYLISGGGSGGTRPVAEKIVYLEEAFTEAGIEVNKELLNAYAGWDTLDLDSNASSGAPQCTLSNPTEDFYTDDLMNQAKAFSNTAVVVISRWGRENGTVKDDNGTTHYDIPLVQVKSKLADDYSRTYLEISTEEELMLDKVKANFENVIVLLNLCNTMELGFLDDEGIDAAMFVGTTGQSGTAAIPKLLYGDVTPSGRTADIYAYEHQADPTWAFTKPDYTNSSYKYTTYQEGIYYGYRWYETAYADKIQMTVNGIDLDFSTEAGYNKIVQYPFGYGLSYTSFSWEIIEAPADDTIIEDKSFEGGNEYTIKVRVTNTGTMPGKDVVQLYFTPPYTIGGIEKSAITLVDFAKTETLLPANMTDDGIAESQVVTLTFSDYDIASYDCYDANQNELTGYELEHGTYELKLMNNSHVSASVIPSEASEDSVITMKVLEDIWMPFDYETEEYVGNRYTGEDSYGSPIDGGIEYMTRADFAGTFPTEKVKGAHNVKAAENVYTGLETIEYGQDNGLYFVTLADGSKPSMDDLKGLTGAELKYNEELLKQLGDYDNDEIWNQFLSQITKEETLNIIKMGGMQISAVESLGFMRTVEGDGPSGITNSVLNADVAMNRTGWQAESLMGCSWNPKMAYNMGRAVGLEARTIVNIHGWYAPGVNLHRSPYTSRNFEYYSEDPVLSGKLGAEVIRGAKNNGLVCYLKHFAVSEGGKNPSQVYTWLTEQTMREIYLKPFEICVKEGGANAVMSSFNRIGDVGAYHNQALLQGILRDEWGFRGCVITDWWGTYMTTEDCVLASNDKLLNKTNIDGSVNRENNQTIDLSDPNSPESNMARRAVKNIIFPIVDSYLTAKDYAENGEVDDPYAVNIDKITVTQEDYSPTFVALWIGIDVLLGALFLLCVVKIFKRS